MKNNAKTNFLWLIAFILCAVCEVMLFVASLKMLMNIKGATGDVASSLRAEGIICIFCAIVAFALCITGTKLLLQKGFSRKVSNQLLSVLILDVFANITSWVITIINLSNQGGFNIGVGRVMVFILYIVAIFLFSYASKANSYKRHSIMTIVGFLLLFVSSIVFMIVDENTAPLVLVYYIINLVNFIIMIAAFWLIKDKKNDVNSGSSIAASHIDRSDIVNPDNKSESYQKLKELKDLYNAGLISEEEYNEKRAKYIDSL